MKEYREAKLRIFENQQESEWAVVPSGNDLPELKARSLTFSVTSPEGDLTLQGTEIFYLKKPLLDLSKTQLRGPHNAANAMAAFGVGIALGADLRKMGEAICNYTPPAHRCEFIGERGGVRWINDSKATNLDAMEQAIRSVEGPLILIAGGKDKGFEFAPIASLVREHVELAILIGEMRHRIAHDWEGTPSFIVGSLEEAVTLAAEKGRKGTTVLFSPGTSSFDMFRDYIQRGETYRRLVERLPR
jgi:UDP-N-acetylmuramoylalanine--D-glutamate ligase